MTNESSSNASKFEHLPVLTDVILEFSKTLSTEMLHKGLMIDATLGSGGHSAALLESHQNLRCIGLDQDPQATKAAQASLVMFSERVKIINSNFANFNPDDKAILILADLGVSSPQLDESERGFSFQSDGPIDMRMNPNDTITAADLIKNLSENELADLIFNYGEEKFSRRISRKIKEDLKSNGNYSGTKELAYAIAGCYPAKMRYGRIHPATRTFQALRIGVNNELENLSKFLLKAPNWLEVNGLMLIISFHSLEDRIVKNVFKENKSLERINRKPIIANEIEKATNPRSRSAKLRVAKKID